MKAIQILTVFYAKAGGRKRFHTTESVFRDALHIDPNASRRTVNVEPDLQQKSDDRVPMPSAFSRCFRTTSRSSSRRPQRPSPKAVRIFDKFTGKAGEGAWDSVETDAYDSHRRENSTRVICEYFERDTGH